MVKTHFRNVDVVCGGGHAGIIRFLPFLSISPHNPIYRAPKIFKVAFYLYKVKQYERRNYRFLKNGIVVRSLVV